MNTEEVEIIKMREEAELKAKKLFENRIKQLLERRTSDDEIRKNNNYILESNLQIPKYYVPQILDRQFDEEYENEESSTTGS